VHGHNFGFSEARKHTSDIQQMGQDTFVWGPRFGRRNSLLIHLFINQWLSAFSVH